MDADLDSRFQESSLSDLRRCVSGSPNEAGINIRHGGESIPYSIDGIDKTQPGFKPALSLTQIKSSQSLAYGTPNSSSHPHPLSPQK
ncbi:hypothetical protein J6590_046244 [Homalodisca vitripennis]|nr:hypothetical protein J6590_046244 [Homalodisca vitripennis]